MSLAEIAAAEQARKLPPVESWSPQRSMDSGIQIAADGTWYHQGAIIPRPSMVLAFSALLMRDDQGRHWLVTPESRQSVAVEDAAFIAVDMLARPEGLAFRLNTGELIVAGPDHPIVARGDDETPAIYLGVRHGCEARLDRSTWVQLAEYALARGDDLAVTSQGARFSLHPA